MNSYKGNNTTLRQMLTSIHHNFSLIIALTKREVMGRYSGSFIGLAWSFINPLLMLAVYTFLFSVVFKARWNIPSAQSQTDFAVVLFVGLIIYNLFAECINRAPLLVVNHVNYVKKIVFPLEILPCVAICTGLFHTLISFLMLLTIQLFITGSVIWTTIFFPFILIPLILIILGISWFLSALGVYVRDVSQITSFFTTILMFISPVFYSLEALTEKLKPLMLLNPLAFIIEESRKTILLGIPPNWLNLMIYTICSFFIAWGGFWVFQKMRTRFADVL